MYFQCEASLKATGQTSDTLRNEKHWRKDFRTAKTYQVAPSSVLLETSGIIEDVLADPLAVAVALPVAEAPAEVVADA